ncbi:hypothetical protein VB654_13630 [Nodularia sp. UHCC 0506]|nr:hypothetical protein [Nodularia sp. UHCC 0506]MEA5515080.1 hypothetical protein [Nodularia sp. UHCC 0506]
MTACVPHNIGKCCNLQRLDAALSFCQQNNIRLYRMTSALFPTQRRSDRTFALLVAYGTIILKNTLHLGAK